jgi:hypothetical protein
MWTPGYWSYASAGYYWAPGVWVVAPYVGALWTPPYWGFQNGRYREHHGYWASHVGYYGGVDYGFGYVGRGYEGGYWKQGTFNYNRSVNHVNTTVIHNVYNYRVTNITNVRISYVGGQGGLNVRPTPSEIAVLHERRLAPVPAQVTYVRQAQANHAQFASVNGGRPQIVVDIHPLVTAYHAPAPHVAAVPGGRVLASAPERREPVTVRQQQPAAGRPAVEPRQPARPAPERPQQAAPIRQENRPAAEPRPAARPVPEHPQQAAPVRPENRPVAEPRAAARPVPERPQQAAPVRPENRPAVEPRPAARPLPERKPQAAPERQERQPAAEPRTAARPAPAARPSEHPAPENKPERREPPKPPPTEPKRDDGH